jgi:hypothetical protein
MRPYANPRVTGDMIRKLGERLQALCPLAAPYRPQSLN